LQDNQQLDRLLTRLPLASCVVIGLSTTIHLSSVTKFLDKFFNRLPSSEVSDRIWVISGGVVSIAFCIIGLRNIRIFRLSSVVQGLLIAVLFVGTFFATSIESNYGGMRDRYWMGFGSTYSVVFIGLFLSILFSLRKRAQRINSVISNARVSYLGWTKFIFIYGTWSFFFIPILLKTTYQPRDPYHSAYVINEQLGYLQGRPPLFETIGQYGNIVYAPTWLFARLPITNLEACFLYLSCLTFLFFLTFFGLVTLIFKRMDTCMGTFLPVADRTVRSSRDLCFLFGSAMMLQGSPNFISRNNGLLSNLISSIPVRSFFPIFLIFLSLLICSQLLDPTQTTKKMSPRRLNALMGFFLLTCLATAINNFEFGLVLSISVPVTLWIWIWRVDRRTVRKLSWILGSFFPLLFALIFLVKGSNGEPLGSNWVGFSRGFGADGAYNIPIPSFGVHMLFIGWFGATLATGMSLLLKFDNSTHKGRHLGLISLVMVNASIWGFACLAYFSGRSIVSGQLQLSLIPFSIILVAWSALAFLKFKTMNDVETETFSASSNKTKSPWVILIFAPALLAASIVNLPNPIAGIKSIKPTAGSSVQNSWRDLDLQSDLQILFQQYGISSSTPTYSQFGNLGKELLGVTPTGVLNSPLDTTISEVLRDSDCKSLLSTVRSSHQNLIAVDLTSLPMQGIEWLCPALRQVSTRFGRVALFSER
jgi:hypothetical protein